MARVSVIIATRNAELTLEDCLESIKNQSQSPWELLVVDRDSSDRTKEIAKDFTDKVYNHGPERSSQRNYGAKLASGDYLLFIDADMVLSKDVLKSVTGLLDSDQDLKALVIPEESFGKGFWAQVKSFERSFYIGDSSIEAVRLVNRVVFQELGGYDETMVAGEDWDLHQRVKKHHFKIGRVDEKIYHNEGRLTLAKTLRKKYYYGSQFKHFLKKNKPNYSQVSVFRTGFFKDPGRLLANPLLTLSLFVLKTLELGAGFLGLVVSLISRQNKQN